MNTPYAGQAPRRGSNIDVGSAAVAGEGNDDPLLRLSRLSGVGVEVAAAQAAVDAVLRDRGLRRISDEQSAAGLLSAVRASAQLEPEPQRWLTGSVRAATEYVQLAGRIRSAPGQVLARLHLLLEHGQLAVADLGRLRGDVDGERLTGLTRLLTASGSAPTIVLASIAHAEIAWIRPFRASGDGPDALIARAVEHLVLMSGGIDPAGVINIEQGHLDAGAGYLGALSAYRTGTPDGVREWLVHCARALARGAEVSLVHNRS